jgi:hypothetical protein
VIAPWLNLRSLFLRRVGHPINGWLATGGVEMLVRWTAYAVVFVLFAAIIAISVDLIFGAGIFEQGIGCDGKDPYDPCPGERNIYGDNDSYRAE